MNRIFSAATAVCVCFAGLFAACDDETIELGVPSATDVMTPATESFLLTTRSVRMDSVMANSSKSYLGEIEDPETGTDIKAEFISQFYCFDDYSLPSESRMFKDKDGSILADSVEVVLYFNDYYGDGTNPMKLAVYELDTANVISEGKTYYADINLAQYRKSVEPLTTKVFTPNDYSVSTGVRESATYYANVRIKLPVSFGSELLQKAVKNPQYLMNSWQFIHHLCPGLYFQLVAGKGTMLTVDVATMNVHFRYLSKETDTTYTAGFSRFSATTEVIQSTAIENRGIDALLSQTDSAFTYLKSPAGVATEMTLPIDEIFEGHEGDSISRARVILTRLNSRTKSPWALDPPARLLLVTHDRRHSFFTSHSVADNETAFTTSFDSNYNTYTFPNISRLISYLHRQKLKGMEQERITSSEEWNATHPNWNRVIIMPVSVVTTSDASTGSTKQVAINHDFSLTSARLVGGSQPIQMQVIYSSYQGN